MVCYQILGCGILGSFLSHHLPLETILGDMIGLIGIIGNDRRIGCRLSDDADNAFENFETYRIDDRGIFLFVLLLRQIDLSHRTRAKLRFKAFDRNDDLAIAFVFIAAGFGLTRTDGVANDRFRQRKDGVHEIDKRIATRQDVPENEKGAGVFVISLFEFVDDRTHFGIDAQRSQCTRFCR